MSILRASSFGQQYTHSTVNSVTVVLAGLRSNRVVCNHPHNPSWLLRPHRGNAICKTRQASKQNTGLPLHPQAAAVVRGRTTALLQVSIPPCFCRLERHSSAWIQRGTCCSRRTFATCWAGTCLPAKPMSGSVLSSILGVESAGPSNNLHLHMSNEGTGFFPGHASLAYFFFLGSGGRLASAVAGWAVTTGAAGFTRGALAGSISGAGLGR